MKKLLPILLLSPLGSLAQEIGREIEPGQETSYTNKDLLLLALAALAVLMAVYFLFRRAKKRRG